MWNWKTCIFAGSSRQFPSLSYPCPVLQRGHASFHISWTLLGSSSCSWSSGWFSCDPAPVPPAVLSWCWCRGRREPVGFRPDFRCGGGFPWTFFFFLKHCALVLFGPSRGEPGIPGQAASSAAMRVCLPGLWDGQHYLGLLPSCCSCHTWRRKGTLQASNACLSGLPFPLRTSSVECRAGLVPMASSMTGAAGGYFCSGGVRGTKVQLPGAVLHVGLCRGSQVRAGCVSFKEWELSWCQPSPHTFSKSLPPSLPFQPLSFRPRGHGSGLPHFSPACCSNSSWHLIHPHPILCGLGTDPLFSI